MKNSRVLKTVLFIAGLIGVGIGSAILFFPVAFHATSGITIGNDISLLNEIRAPGGVLLAIGILIILGAVYEKLTFTATIVATFVYLSYGLSRIVSIMLDGFPSSALIQVMVFEIVVGLLCGFLLLRYKHQDMANN